MNLLSTVYSQSWPAPDPKKQHNRGLQGKLTPRSPRKTKNNPVSGRVYQQKYGISEQQGCHGKGILAIQGRQSPRVPSQQLALTPSRHAGLDEETYKWKTWTNYKQDCDNNSNDLTLYKITQDTFRKLSEQVREVNAQISKFQNTGFKSYHTGSNASPVIRPTQLATSLPHQSPSISREPPTDNMAPQCTSVQRSNRRRPHSHSVTSNQRQSNLPQRPHSTTALYGRQATSEFDQLTPKMIGALSNGKQRVSDPSQLGPFDIVANEAKPEIQEIEEDESDMSDGESEPPHHYRVRTPPDFDLPPEDMDIHDRRGQFQYRSSSARKNKQEPYPEPLSKPYCYFDLLELSLLKEDWRHAVRTVPEGVEEKLIDRLIEMERLQIASAEMERGQHIAPPKRAMSAMQIRKGWNAAASIPTERAQSALARPRQSKNCSPGCLQPLCPGTCDTKQDPLASRGCHHCKQEYCQGSCTEFGYHLHIRQPREEEVSTPTSRPKSCKSCNGRSLSRKSTLNTNTVILGRPKSAFATFSSAKQWSRKPQSISAEARSVSGQMAKLELSSTPDADGDRPPRPKTAPGSSRSKPKGRNSMLPGKSFTSQRRHSLTDEPISTSAAKMNPKHMRIKSAKLKTKQKKISKK